MEGVGESLARVIGTPLFIYEYMYHFCGPDVYLSPSINMVIMVSMGQPVQNIHILS
jgi:hypothetical protein